MNIKSKIITQKHNLNSVKSYRVSHTSKLILILLVIHCSHTIFAQAVKINLEEIQTSINRALNTDSSQSLFSLCSDAMKKRNAVENLALTFTKIRNQLGPSISLDLTKSSEDNYQFKSTHKIATLLLDFTLDIDGRIDKMRIGPFPSEHTSIERNKTALILPFKGEWFVFWGGKSLRDNYHNAQRNMFGAFDFWVLGSNEKSHQENHSKNEDFYAFGQEILAPADGRIIFVKNDIKDNVWPNINRDIPYGNAIMIETKEKEYITLAHLKEQSIEVEVGQEVKQGDLLGLCGNSGHSTEPHLHFQLQHSPDLMSGLGALSHFARIIVNGEIKTDYSPKKGEKISN